MPAKDDCNRLLNSLMAFAEKMLKEHGEFLPFGAQMLMNGEIVSVAANNGEEHPQLTELIDLLRNAFKNGAEDGTLLATGLAYDVRVVPPGRDQKSDAIALDLDHRDLYSVRVFYPYTIGEGGVSIGDVFASNGDYGIFPPANSLPI